MIIFPVGENLLCVIEPGNIARIKEGAPLRIALPDGRILLIAYTPDGPELERRVTPLLPVSAESLDALLESCLKLPEVMR